jgi:hypothetical protein
VSRDLHDAETPETESAADGSVKKGSFDVTMDEGIAAAQNASVRRRLSTGTLIMGGVVAIAATSLWSMRAIDRAVAAGPRISKENEKLVDDILKRGKGADLAIDTDATRLLEPADAVGEVRVPLRELAKNPFVLWTPPASAAAPSADGGPAPVPVDTRAERIAEWEQKVDQAAGSIRVLSTMSGTGPVGATGIANVNGHMMRIGDVFGIANSDIEFSIERVERDALTVRAYNAELRHERIVTVKVNRKW